MDFRILGPIEVLSEGRAVSLGGSRQRALLGLFLIHANETLSVDRLMDELFGGRAQAPSPKAMHVQISRLRKSLAAHPGGEGLIVTHGSGYELAIDPDHVDANRFERLVAEGGQERPSAVPLPLPSHSSARSTCGAAPRSPISPTSASPRRRSHGSTSCGSARSSSAWTRSWRSATTPTSSAGCRASSTSTRTASGSAPS